MPGEAEPQVRAWVDYFRDLGVHDFYRRGEFVAAAVAEETVVAEIHAEEVALVGSSSAAVVIRRAVMRFLSRSRLRRGILLLR